MKKEAETASISRKSSRARIDHSNIRQQHWFDIVEVDVDIVHCVVEVLALATCLMITACMHSYMLIEFSMLVS